MNRRNFIQMAGAVAGLSLASCASVSPVSDLAVKKGRRVVVVGGGYGGAIAAKYIRMSDPSIEVVLIERNKTFISCPFSNLVIGGTRNLKENMISYDALASNHGVKMVFEEVTAVDAAAKKIRVASGDISYDRLILSPGIDFRFSEIEGYDPIETPRVIPHAWKAGEQTLLLRQQLVDMPDGGLVVLSIPLTPYRCPPGPYERISQIAWYLKNHKPKSKIIVLDANPDIISKGPLFRKAWEKHYKGMIEFRASNQITEVNTKARSVGNGVEEFKGAVVNMIPPQKAGLIAHLAGVVGEDKKWCPVNQTTFESTLVPGVHVIGDACMAGPMPKSGYSANSQAKVCALNVVQMMNGLPTIPPSHVNVCYSFVTDKEAISVSGVYKLDDKGATIAVPNSGGVSPDLSELEGVYAKSWIKNILHEMSS
jgi:sulfide dehydrogenase [flavocytochrome c] flavoprotein subunit